MVVVVVVVVAFARENQGGGGGVGGVGVGRVGVGGIARVPRVFLHRTPHTHVAPFTAQDIPTARLQWVEDCGHVPHLEQPTLTADTIAGFVAKEGK